MVIKKNNNLYTRIDVSNLVQYFNIKILFKVFKNCCFLLFQRKNKVHSIENPFYYMSLSSLVGLYIGLAGDGLGELGEYVGLVGEYLGLVGE